LRGGGGVGGWYLGEYLKGGEIILACDLRGFSLSQLAPLFLGL
jgi:hypothetical protein